MLWRQVGRRRVAEAGVGAVRAVRGAGAGGRIEVCFLGEQALIEEKRARHEARKESTH